MHLLILFSPGACLIRSVVLLVIVSVTGQSVVGQELGKLIYSDPLSDVAQSRWIVFGGEVRSSSGALRLSGQLGPRAMLAGIQVSSFELQVEIKPEENTQAGIVFRAADSQVGIDAYRGYYVGLHSEANRVMWGASKPGWQALAGGNRTIESSQWYRLRVRVVDANVMCYVDEMPVLQESLPVFDGVDRAFDRGSIGFRVLGTAAEFRNLTIREVVDSNRSESYTNPVQADCADPVILRHDGIYYAYCTHSPDSPDMVHGIRLHVSKDLVHWKDQGYVLKKEDSWGDSRFWAPDIVERDGRFYLYYAADTRICVASADSPTGPFRQQYQRPMTPDSIRIDAHVFQDVDGQNYIYYVDFNRGNQIWGGRLNEDMISVDADSLRRMIVPDQAWERHRGNIVEGPEILKRNGVYYLTYSGSHFESPEYAVGYATSDSPLGPWEKHDRNPIMKSTSYAHGTAHHCFTYSPDGSELFIVYHRHHSLTQTEPRQLSIDRAMFVRQKNGPDVLQIHGPTSSPQPMPADTFD
ncbi:family 43 glycosylhydrolase [bacterium]|nr:family 43 glycosylhydrolase [bacterium]